MEENICKWYEQKQIQTTQHKWLIQLKIQKPNDPVKIWVEEMNRRFSKEDMQMVNRYMKRCSTLLAIREMQIKITMRTKEK